MIRWYTDKIMGVELFFGEVSGDGMDEVNARMMLAEFADDNLQHTDFLYKQTGNRSLVVAPVSYTENECFKHFNVANHISPTEARRETWKR